MFKDSTFQYILDDEEERLIADESTDYKQANEDLLSQMQRVPPALDNATPPQVLPVAPPPLSSPLQPPRELTASPPPVVVPPPPATPLLTPREATPHSPTPIVPQLLTPTPVKLIQSPPTPILPAANESDKEANEQPVVPKGNKGKEYTRQAQHTSSFHSQSFKSSPSRIRQITGTSLEWL